MTDGSDGTWRRYEVADLIAAGVLEIGDGYRAKNSELGASGLPFARAANVREEIRLEGADRFPSERLDVLGGKTSKPGDAVLTAKGTVGRVAFVRNSTPRFVYSPQLCFWRSRDHCQLDPRFLFHWMSGADFQAQLNSVSGQTDMAAYVSLRDQRQMSLSMPSPPEQRAIARVLGALVDRIELNRRMNDTLEAMARALFKSWFVDFDPVWAKMEGRDTGLPPEIADLFPDRLVDSELGEIPEGWKIGTLRHLAVLNPEVWNSAEPPETIRYIDLKNTKWGVIGEVPCYAWREAPSRARRVLRKGDTVVGTVRPGNGSYALIDEDGLTGSTAFAALRPRAPLDRELVWSAATSSNNVSRLALLADGGAYPAIGGDVVAATPVVLADAPVRREFSAVVSPLLDEMGGNRRTSRRLAELRDALLPALVSGEVRVPPALAERYGDPAVPAN